MSNPYEEDEYETNAMRVLREKAEADSALIREELTNMRQERQKAEATKVAKDLGVDPSALALAPADADPVKWLQDNAKLFAKATPVGEADPVTQNGEDSPDAPVSTIPEAEAEAHAAIAESAREAQPPVGLNSLTSAIASADSPEAVAALLAKELGNARVNLG
jgi:hypothetical protein